MSSDILFEASETFTASWFEPGLLQECTFEQCVQIGRNFATLAKFDIYLAIFRRRYDHPSVSFSQKMIFGHLFFGHLSKILKECFLATNDVGPFSWCLKRETVINVCPIHRQCDQIMELNVANFSNICPKGSHRSFTLKGAVFRNSPKK